MTITAKVIADSVSPQGIRLTTVEARYPRWIHSEVMTHRAFSRNASSSRAIPVHKMIEELKRDPGTPVFWGSNRPGMQAGDELSGADLAYVKKVWLDARDSAIVYVEKLMSAGLHKQISNRVLEPWAHIRVVISATEWANFFALRIHEAAQPEIKVLAEEIKRAMDASTPVQRARGDWHLPYVTDEERAALPDPKEDDVAFCYAYSGLVRLSVARCASVSYKTVDGQEMTAEKAQALYEKLVGANPIHASPAEHQATPDIQVWKSLGSLPEWSDAKRHGNLQGWIQFRKTLANENITSN